MDFKLDTIEDKVEFFEALDLKVLEKKINEKIDQNKAILLQVHSVQHQSHLDIDSGYRYFSAMVHFKVNRFR